MTEIRPIVESEADDFLELLCAVFHLDLGRARGIFFTEPLFDLDRKWGLFEGKDLISILTTTPLEFGWGRAYGIAGVATRADRQGEGHASKLLQRVHKECERAGETGGLLFAKETGLYSRNGYELIDRVVRGAVKCNPNGHPKSATVDNSTVEAFYNDWAALHPDRLRRDEKRWAYWHWNYRVCEPFEDGYLCAEPATLREIIFSPKQESLPLHHPTDWFGTTFMADQFQLPFEAQPKVELYLMGRNVPGVPQMFMTDQF